MAWLQGELGRRGAPFNPIHAGPGADLDVAFFAELLPGCLEGHGGGCEQVTHCLCVPGHEYDQCNVRLTVCY